MPVVSHDSTNDSSLQIMSDEETSSGLILTTRNRHLLYLLEERGLHRKAEWRSTHTREEPDPGIQVRGHHVNFDFVSWLREFGLGFSNGGKGVM
jgi:hypothetical protein